MLRTANYAWQCRSGSRVTARHRKVRLCVKLRRFGGVVEIVWHSQMSELCAGCGPRGFTHGCWPHAACHRWSRAAYICASRAISRLGLAVGAPAGFRRMTVNHATSHMSSEFVKTETDEFTIYEGKASGGSCVAPHQLESVNVHID